MAFRKQVMITVALLTISGLLFGCSSDDNTVSPAPPTEAPLIAPSNVTATRMANGDISLTWDSITQANLKGYNVYRLSSEDMQIGLLNVTPLTTNRYLDTNTEDRAFYQYFVASISVKNVESSPTSVTLYNVTKEPKGPYARH
jgi:fibronectin type 3 domain-containing protein